jgi:hypothetical protein
MTYVELTHEMIDSELVMQFPTQNLRRLLCLPLYESEREIHFAIADPADAEIVRRVKSLRPGKIVTLHLALPEKILDILSFYEQPEGAVSVAEKGVYPPLTVTEPTEISQLESYWNDLVAMLLSTSPGEAIWIYGILSDNRLIREKGGAFETVRRYPDNVYRWIKERLEQNKVWGAPASCDRLLVQDRSSGRQGAFKVWSVDCLGGQIMSLQRVPSFSPEDFLLSCPHVPNMLGQLRSLFDEHSRLVVGGKEGLFIKQCLYLLLISGEYQSDFPPAFIVEREMEMYFPQVAQVSHQAFVKASLLDRFGHAHEPFILYEADLPGLDSMVEDKHLSQLLSGERKNVIVYIPCASIEAMRSILAQQREWRRDTFNAIFFHNQQLRVV